jgi:hypothetical protein
MIKTPEKPRPRQTDVNDKKRSDPKRTLRQEKQGEEMRQTTREAARKRRLN